MIRKMVDKIYETMFRIILRQEWDAARAGAAAPVMPEEDAMIGQAEPASVVANRELARRFFAEQDRLRGGPAEALCDASYRANLGGNPPVDLAGHQAFARAFYSAFSAETHHEIQQIVALTGSPCAS
jgi:uncharacterized ParB-like nuclease family protein